MRKPMNDNPIKDFILASERNLTIAASITEAWPEARNRIIFNFLNRLGSKLVKQLNGWKVDSSEFDSSAPSFKEQWACFNVYKPSWKNQYFVSLQCYNYGETMFFGVIRDESQSHIAKRPFCEEILDIVRKFYPSARPSKWWEARTIMRSPNPDWRNPEALWRIHSDKTVLDDIAKQFLDVAKSTEHMIDKLARQK
jgi:hypothetical protein